jgi:transketolase
VRKDVNETNLSRHGAYVLREADGGPRAVTLLATGSEVAIALKARDTLQAKNIPTAVVSMPCCELFDAQDEAYRFSVLGKGTVRVAVEAAVRFGWDRYLGEHGGFIGMKGFGASGPADLLYEHFGITPAAIVEEARRLLSHKF